jgi:chromosome segregation ATPase
MKLPPKIMLDTKDIPIFDQGGLGSSTACAVATAAMIQAKKPTLEERIEELEGEISNLSHEVRSLKDAINEILRRCENGNLRIQT